MTKKATTYADLMKALIACLDEHPECVVLEFTRAIQNQYPDVMNLVALLTKKGALVQERPIRVSSRGRFVFKQPLTTVDEALLERIDDSDVLSTGITAEDMEWMRHYQQLSKQRQRQRRAERL